MMKKSNRTKLWQLLFCSFYSLLSMSGSSVQANEEVASTSAEVKENDAAAQPETEKATFTCSQCNLVFVGQPAFRTHLHRAHKYYKCRSCDNSFNSRSMRDFHRWVKHRSKRAAQRFQRPLRASMHQAECPINGCEEEGLETLLDKAVHLCIAHNKTGQEAILILGIGRQAGHRHGVDVFYYPRFNNFVCGICKVKVPNRNSAGMVDHLYSAHKIAIHGMSTCDTCPKLFPNKSNYLKSHQAQCGKAEQCRCDKCDRIFDSKHAMYTHKSTKHSTQTEYPCIECGKVYATSRGRTSHESRFHPSVVGHIVACRRAECNGRGLRFLRGKSYDAHVERFHTDKSEALEE